MKFLLHFITKALQITVENVPHWKVIPLFESGKCFKILPLKSQCTRDRSVPLKKSSPYLNSVPIYLRRCRQNNRIARLVKLLKKGCLGRKVLQIFWPSLTFEEFLYLYNVPISRPKYVKHFTLVVSSRKAIWPEIKHFQCC